MGQHLTDMGLYLRRYGTTPDRHGTISDIYETPPDRHGTISDIYETPPDRHGTISEKIWDNT